MGRILRDGVVTTTSSLGTMAFLRWIWGQLTSMRTALLLLFLLAVAAIPGSMIPQSSVSPIEVLDFKRENPALAGPFEMLGFFEVYSSPWFSAVYLLLFVSLVGCIVPRCFTFARQLRQPPPRLPARPERMAAGGLGIADDQSLHRASQWLKAHRFRLRVTDEGISAERGRLREAGNLVFHTALVAMLIGLAWSALLGFKGTSVVVEKHSFSNVITQYDDFSHGGLYDTTTLEPFTITVNRFDAAFETGDVQRGAARQFDAYVTVTEGGQQRDALLQVNEPISLPGGTQINLLGHGYAPIVTVTDGNGDVAFSGPSVFLPQDGNFSSAGVIKAPDARPQRLAFEGFFMPTSVIESEGPRSVFPDALNPELFLNAWRGAPKTETGEPESVYVLNTAGLEPVPSASGEDRLRMRLTPGSSVDLPDGLGTVTFEGWSRWVKLQFSETPGNAMTLISLLIAIAGLCCSLFVTPRRLFVRVRGQQVAVGGLDRSDSGSGLEDDVAELLAQVSAKRTETADPVNKQEDPS